MPSKNNFRNHRNNPYVLDDLAMQVHHSAAGVIWRMRTEVATLAASASAFAALDMAITVVWAARRPGRRPDCLVRPAVD